MNQFATCDISYVLRIKTSEFICKESVHILCALSMKQYWSNLVYTQAFTCKRDTYVSTQRYWQPILMNENSSTNLWYCLKIQLQHSNQTKYILIYEGENVSIQNRNLCIGYQYQRWKILSRVIADLCRAKMEEQVHRVCKYNRLDFLHSFVSLYFAGAEIVHFWTR